MINFISTYFVNAQFIDGGIQLNFGWAAVVVVIWGCTWMTKRFVKKA